MNTWNWRDWKINDKNKKPFLENGPCFNISHSGNLVVVVFSDTHEVGVDIEHIQDIDAASIAGHFHENEIHYLKNNHYNKELFYEIWTRKEALLKASGEGITNGLNKISVLENKLFHDKEWIIQNIDLHPNYKCAICSEADNSNNINIEEIDYETLNKFIHEKILI